MHETYMRRCLALGRAALEAGEIPVGAIVVRGEEVLGEGIEEVRSRLDPSAHVPAGQAGGVTSRYDLLVDPELAGWPMPPEIVSGVLEDECRALLEERARSLGST
jgi:tRNA(Arg) A34 adenosine deaminase TadA